MEISLADVSSSTITDYFLVARYVTFLQRSYKYCIINWHQTQTVEIVLSPPLFDRSQCNAVSSTKQSVDKMWHGVDTTSITIWHYVDSRGSTNGNCIYYTWHNVVVYCGKTWHCILQHQWHGVALFYYTNGTTRLRRLPCITIMNSPYKTWLVFCLVIRHIPA